MATLGFPANVTNFIKNVEYNTFPNISVSQYTVGTGLSVTSGSSQEVSSLAGGNQAVTPSQNAQIQYDVTSDARTSQNSFRNAVREVDAG